MEEEDKLNASKNAIWLPVKKNMEHKIINANLMSLELHTQKIMNMNL